MALAATSDIYWQCLRKRTFSSRFAAKDQLRNLRRKFGREYTARLEFYRCPWCRLWHVGNRPGT